MKYRKYIAGIDEAGRGPLAGPVSVGICHVSKNFTRDSYRKIFGLLKDSKKLSEKRREEIFEKIREVAKEGKIKWAVVLVSEKIIDKKGIVEAINIGIRKCLEKVGAEPLETQILLDGGIYAPKEFVNQKTIIKGDEKEPIISLASICAKVVRDKKMIKLSKIHKGYGFEIHKGYGTKMHCENINRFGLGAVHRKSFCKNLVEKKLSAM